MIAGGDNNKRASAPIRPVINPPTSKRVGVEETFTRFSGGGHAPNQERSASDNSDENSINKLTPDMTDQDKEQLNIFSPRSQEDKITNEPKKEPSSDSSEESPSDIFSRRGPNRGGSKRGD